MIYCVHFSEVDAHLCDLAYSKAGETDAHLLYRSARDLITIHRPNAYGDITEIETQRACVAAGLEPPVLTPHWCD